MSGRCGLLLLMIGAVSTSIGLHSPIGGGSNHLRGGDTLYCGWCRVMGVTDGCATCNNDGPGSTGCVDTEGSGVRCSTPVTVDVQCFKDHADVVQCPGKRRYWALHEDCPAGQPHVDIGECPFSKRNGSVQWVQGNGSCASNNCTDL